MKQDRRRKWIIAAAAVAAILVLAVVLIVSGPQTGTAAPKEAETKATPEVELQKSAKEKDNTPEENAEPETKKETEMDETLLQPRNTEKMKEPITSVNFEKRQTISGSARELPTETDPGTKAKAEVQQEAKSHQHSYQLVDTRKVEHPAVTKQVWVEDSPAWEEILRPGYHMSVVTCHECGATFADPKQGNALEAWGDHIDAVHNGDGGYDMAASYEVPAETIRHDALGHYEVRTVTAAWTEYLDTYRCSCGDQYTKKR